MKRATGIIAFLTALLLALSAQAQDRFVLGSTTTLENSGFLRWIIPKFTEDTGIGVRVIVHGTGRIHDSARRGDIDAILTHDPAGEQALVESGDIVLYRQVMRNHFLLVGPEADPAGISGMTNAVEAFARIAERRYLFLSRGDDSGTHRAELRIWEDAVSELPAPSSDHWYRSAGAGMGATLNIAAALNAYLLVDEATWTSFNNKRRLVPLAHDEQRLVNTYGVAMVNPNRHLNVRHRAARAFVTWLAGADGQRLISRFNIDGQHVFQPLRREEAALDSAN